MKNKEKYREKILEYKGSEFCEVFIEQLVLKPLGLSCPITCSQCNMVTALWLDEEYKEPETDWSKVAIDTPILVSNDGDIWSKRYFSRYENGKVHAFDLGRTNWSKDNDDNDSIWKYVKLAVLEEKK